jgi:hypothetical protein
MGDLNLATLESGSKSNSTSAKSTGREEERGRDSEGEGTSEVARAKRKGSSLTEEQKAQKNLKIQMALRNRGPLASDHRR